MPTGTHDISTLLATRFQSVAAFGMDTIQQVLDEILGDDVPQAAPAVFHYVGDQVEAEVYLPFDWCVDSVRLDNLQERVRRRVEASPCWGRIALLCRIAP